MGFQLRAPHPVSHSGAAFRTGSVTPGTWRRGVALGGWCHILGVVSHCGEPRGAGGAFGILHLALGIPRFAPRFAHTAGLRGVPQRHFEHNTARRFILLPKIQGGEGGSGTPHGVKRPFQGSSCRRTGCPRSPRCIPAPRVGHGAGRGKRERSSLHPTKRHGREGGGKPPAVAGPWSGIVPLGLNSHNSSSGQQDRRSRAGLLQSEG